MKNKKYHISVGESSIVEIICKDDRVAPFWFYILFMSLRFDMKTNSLRFINMNEFRKYGFIMKRYLEYPKTNTKQDESVFKEISVYLQHGNIVLHYTHTNKGEGCVHLLIDISSSDKMVTFRSYRTNGEMMDKTISYEEYLKRYILSDKKENVMKFDIFNPVITSFSQSKVEEVIKSTIIDGKLSFLKRVKCLLSIKKNNHSLEILRQWFEILEESNEFDLNYIVTDNDKELFKMNGEQTNFLHRYQMLKVYNNFIKYLNRYGRQIYKS